jgi:hypothetical protein
VENVRESTESSFDAYAQSASESSSYIGVELRRLHDLLAEFGERSLQEHYEMRLAHACDLPLDELEESLARLINWATGHRGFYAQAGLWFNPPVEVALSAGAASLVRVNERIVEVPFAMAALSRVERGARVLVIGAADSTFALSAASLGYVVTTIDPRPLGYSHPRLESHRSRFEEWDAPAESFAAAFLISTIQHVGLGQHGEHPYGNREHAAGADMDVLERLRRLVSPDGLVVLTVPCGPRELGDRGQVYDRESLDRLLAGWNIVERRAVVRRDPLVWETREYVDDASRGVAMLIASPERPR